MRVKCGIAKEAEEVTAIDTPVEDKVEYSSDLERLYYENQKNGVPQYTPQEIAVAYTGYNLQTEKDRVALKRIASDDMKSGSKIGKHINQVLYVVERLRSYGDSEVDGMPNFLSLYAGANDAELASYFKFMVITWVTPSVDFNKFLADLKAERLSEFQDALCAAYNRTKPDCGVGEVLETYGKQAISDLGERKAKLRKNGYTSKEIYTDTRCSMYQDTLLLIDGLQYALEGDWDVLWDNLSELHGNNFRNTALDFLVYAHLFRRKAK